MHSQVITTEAQLREIVEPPPAWIAEKAVDHIDATSRQFITRCPFFLLGTTGADGSCDVSPRGDLPGSVLVLDRRTLAFPDRRGNRRLDSLRNILVHPQVGMLFLHPGREDVLRVNGTARVVRGAPYLDDLAIDGHVPPLAVEVRVDELFRHCANALRRSGLWSSAPAHGGVDR